MICPASLHKIFCFIQRPEKGLPHGIAMGEDGTCLGLSPRSTQEDIMRDLSYQGPQYDDHFGVGQWELIFVPQNEVEEVGKNLDFEAAMGKNALKAKEAGLVK